MCEKVFNKKVFYKKVFYKKVFYKININYAIKYEYRKI